MAVPLFLVVTMLFFAFLIYKNLFTDITVKIPQEKLPSEKVHNLKTYSARASHIYFLFLKVFFCFDIKS